jgi:hypothetical protein
MLEAEAAVTGLHVPIAHGGAQQQMVSHAWSSSTTMPPPLPHAPSVRQLAVSMGITGPLSAQDRDAWCCEPSPAEVAALAALRSGADHRLHTAHGGTSTGEPAHLRTALGWLRRFLQVFPSRRLFTPHEGAGDVHAAAYNEETFRLLAEFIRVHGSVRPGHVGDTVSAGAIGDYISALRAFRSREAGYNLLVSGGNLRLPLQMRSMRREDGPAGARELSRALTARLLRKLCRLPGFDRTTRRAVLRWAVLWGGHSLTLRGGEFGAVDNKPFQSSEGITLADLEWIAPCLETDGFEALIVDVLPIKDERVLRDRVPCLVRRRLLPSQPRGADPACAYDAIRDLWELRLRETPSHLLAVSPLFAAADGGCVHTRDVLAFIREAVTSIGEKETDFDARALRIGSATDLFHLFGPVEGERIIGLRGRWCSLIHQIYTRISATRLLDVSASMADATGVDLEAFRHGYVMPAIVRRHRHS